MRLYYLPDEIKLEIENQFEVLDKEYEDLQWKTWELITEKIKYFCIEDKMNFFFTVWGFCLTRGGEDIESDFEVNIEEMLKFYQNRFGGLPFDFEYLYEGHR